MKGELPDDGCCSSKAAAATPNRAPAWHSRLLQHGKALASRVLSGHSRSEQAPGPMEKSMLLFWPWFVESAFQQQYYKSTLGLCDSLCLPLDALIWLVDIVGMLLAGRWPPLEVACTVVPFVAVVACIMYRRHSPDKYRRKRSALTACRRLAVLPFLSWVLLRRVPQATDSWAAAFTHLLILSGGMHVMIATAFFLNSWWIAVGELVVASLMLGSAAPRSCSNILAGPQPYAGWKAAAAVMQKASLGVYSSSVQDPRLDHAVCCASLNTMLVLCACLAGYLVHWFERQQRLRFKNQMPPAVAAMQPHLFGLPPGLMVAQASLLLLYPAMVFGWIILGAWYGLIPSGPPGAASR